MDTSKLTLLPGRGVAFDDGLEILFGMDRLGLRSALAPKIDVPDSYHAGEDDYRDSTLRLRFDKDDRLAEIEVMGGQFSCDGIELFATTFDILDQALNEKFGHSTEWNSMLDRAECAEFGIAFASGFNMGGDEDDDAIAWIMVRKL